ncbi:MAG: hypothetical protein ACX94A_14355, partial [Algiphilus sp.]
LGPPNVRFPARVISEGAHLRLAFDQLDLNQQRALVAATFSRPDAWEHWDDPAEVDRPLASLREILLFGIKGYGLLFRPLLSWTRRTRPAHPTPTSTD